MTDLHTGLKSLGVSADNNAQLYQDALDGYDPATLLERFPNPQALKEINPNGANLTIDFSTPEFTSLCPMTGQPDFATIEVYYTPNEWCVESKSLKLYFVGFRSKRDFHEACVVKICNDLVSLLDPVYLRVVGKFTPRGGIPIWPTVTYVNPENRDDD